MYFKAAALTLACCLSIPFPPLQADVIEQPLGTLYTGESIPNGSVYLLLVSKIENLTRSDALEFVESRIGMSASDATLFVNFATSEARRLEAEANAIRRDMLCSLTDPETIYSRMRILEDLRQINALESMILASAKVAQESSAKLKDYLEARKSSTAYMQTDYRKAFGSLSIDVRSHVEEECATGGGQQ